MTPVLLLLAALTLGSPSATGPRILALVDAITLANSTFSVFFDDIKERGFALDIKAINDPTNKLLSFEERNYDHLVLLSSSANAVGGDVSVSNVIEFVQKGGNVLVATGSEIPELVKDLAIEFSVDFDDRSTAVVDHFRTVEKDAKKPTIYSSNFDAKGVPVVTSSKTTLESLGPIVFKGVAHRLTGRNPLSVAVLKAHDTAFSFDTSVKGVIDPQSPFVGEKVTLVSAVQTRDNARVLFAGSLDVFSNSAFDQQVSVEGELKQSGNRVFATEISKWVLQEKRVLRIKQAHHHKEGETEQRQVYRIKDDVAFEMKVSEWENGVWNAFKASDIQFEAVMLDPYIRKTMSPAKHQPEDGATKYVAFVKLPDHYGVFTLKVDYRRHGYTWIETSDLVEIRPFRHNEYPRFLTVAFPYYANAFSMMTGFVLVSVLFLFHKDQQDKSKVKKS